MTTNPTLDADVQRQIDAGFSLEEIEQNLISNGYTQAEIEAALSETNIQKVIAENSREPYSSRSIYFIIKGGAACLFMLFSFEQSGGFNNNGSAILGVMALVTGILVYFQLKRT